jgi:hypothetical protein
MSEEKLRQVLSGDKGLGSTFCVRRRRARVCVARALDLSHTLLTTRSPLAIRQLQFFDSNSLYIPLVS